MKNLVKPSLLILATLMFGYMGYFLPGTIIQYQVMSDVDQSDISTSQLITGEGLTDFSDQYGIGAIPCRYPSAEPLPNSLVSTFQIWQFIGKVLNSGIVVLGIMSLIRYATQSKISLVKFFVIVVILLASPVAIFLTFPSPSLSPMCDPESLYKLISFVPYWPTVLILIVGILLGIWSIFSVNDSNLQKKELP